MAVGWGSVFEYEAGRRGERRSLDRMDFWFVGLSGGFGGDFVFLLNIRLLAGDVWYFGSRIAVYSFLRG